MIDIVYKYLTFFFAGGGHVFLGRVNGIATPYTMEIIYQLGITQDLGTKQRCGHLFLFMVDFFELFFAFVETVVSIK